MGLTEKEAAARLKKEGLNVPEEKKKSGVMKIFMGQFKDVMVMILLAATVICSGISHGTYSRSAPLYDCSDGKMLP